MGSTNRHGGWADGKKKPPDVPLLLAWFVLAAVLADEEDSGLGKWDGDGFGPLQVTGVILRRSHLGGADQQRQAASRGEQASGEIERRLEAFDGAQGDEVEAAFGGGELFPAAGEDFDLLQLKPARHLAEEGRFLVLRFDQGEADGGLPDLQRQAGEAGAGAEVRAVASGRLPVAREELAGGKEGFANMS